jgi:hypothetical protein
MNPAGLSINWTTLSRQESAAALEELRLLKSQSRLFADPGPTVHAAFALPLAGELIARASALRGPAALKGVFEPFMAAMQRAIDTLPSDPDAYPHLIDLLAFLNLARVHGEDLSFIALSALLDRLRGIVPLLDPDEEFLRLSAAFVAVAFRQSDLIATLVDRPLRSSVTPGEKFAIDYRGFLAYLPAAQLRQTPAATLQATFEDFVAHFPAMMAAEEAQWPMLYSAAAGVYTDIPGVADTVHKLIMQMVAKGF